MDKRIAAGGVGQVWQATDLLLARPVAVKVLRPEYADHPETLERFRQEARLAGALSHPRIAQVYDYGPAGPGGSPYLVLELVAGPSLAELLDGRPIDSAFALDVIAQAADGLSAAHRAGLVHRDVKPANILIGPEGRVKLTDFGIAHAIGHAPVTTPGLVMGTTQYMAPERISGGPGTPASDLYALGIVLHECLTGTTPYEGAPADVMAAHLYSPMPALPPGTPSELGALVAQLTAKDPARRIGNARELAGLASRLRDALDAGQLVAVPASGTAVDLPVLRPAAASAARLSTVALLAPADSLADTPVTGTLDSSRDTPGRAVPGLAAGVGGPPDSDGFPRFAALAPGDYPRRRLGVMTAGGLLVVAAGLAAVLVSGALGPAPTADRTPVVPTAARPASSGARPAPSRSPVSPGPTAGAVVGAGPTTATAKPTASARPRHNRAPVGTTTASPTASASPTTSPAGPSPTPSGSPTGAPSGTPSSSPSGTPSPSPSPSATPTPTPTGLICLGALCL